MITSSQTDRENGKRFWLLAKVRESNSNIQYLCVIMGTHILIIWGKDVMNYSYILLDIEFSAKYLVSKRREKNEEEELIEE